MSPASTKIATVKPITIEEEYAKCSDIRPEDLKNLREWLDKQPHMPKGIPETYLAMFLRACQCSIERAKSTIDNFYTFRTLVPEMSQKRTTDQKDIRQCLNTVEMVALDQTDPQGNVVIMQRMRDFDPAKYDPNVTMRTISMVTEAYLYEHGSMPGVILIFDQKGYGLYHIAKISISQAKKIFYYLQECVAVQVKKIHIVNANQYIEKILMFFKAFMNKQLADAIQVHREGCLDELWKEVPRDILPSDYGGTGKTMAELHDEMAARLPQFDDLMRASDKLLVDESKRPGKAKSTQTLFGIEGSFKKLDID